MLNYPEIDPVIFPITETLQVRWYGVLYLVGFAGCWLMCHFKSKKLANWHTKESLGDLFFYMFWGVILGGRLGYMLFYFWEPWLADPLLVFKTWQGGMSFHGGLIGVIIAMFYFSRRNGVSVLQISDLIAPTIPFALAMGRIGNFINGELWGKVTDVPWAMVFPHVDKLPRHPSQLYAVLLEGLLLFVFLWIYTRKPRPTGQTSGMFLIGYGLVRCFEELFRQPDPQYGYLAFGWVTMGQILCVPMILIGAWLLTRTPCRTT